MALVNIDTSFRQILMRLKKCALSEGIEVLSYKRNRGVFIMLKSENEVLVMERGYVEKDIAVPLDDLQKTLKAIFKVEFPRSRKVRVSSINDMSAMSRKRKRL